MINGKMRRRRTGQKAKKGNYAFIDSQNLNLGTQKMGWKMDWAKFRAMLRDQHNVTHAYMFIGYMPEYEVMYNQLHEMGYLIVLKPTLEMLAIPKPETAESEDKEKEHKQPVKGNIDADLVLYAMKELPNYHKAIIVSGDGDFYGLIEYLAEQKKLKHIMTPNWQYSTLLKNFEPYILRLDQERKLLAYHDRKRYKKKPAAKST